MANETDKKDEIEVNAAFVNASNEARRLEREAMPCGTKVFPNGAIFEQFNVEKISIDSYESALKDAQEIESRGVRATKKVEEKAKRPSLQSSISEKELERIPQEKVEVLTRSEFEIEEEEKKLRNMKDRFAKLMEEIPTERKPAETQKGEPAKAPEEKMSILNKPEEKLPVNEPEAVFKEEKPKVDAAKAEEIKELSENFKMITMKKDERDKQERIRKMKKDIEDMLESG